MTEGVRERLFGDAKNRVDAVAIGQSPIFDANPGAIADLAAKKRLPWIGNKEYGEFGEPIGYGVNFLGMYRRTTYFVDKILKAAITRIRPLHLGHSSGSA